MTGLPTKKPPCPWCGESSSELLRLHVDNAPSGHRTGRIRCVGCGSEGPPCDLPATGILTDEDRAACWAVWELRERERKDIQHGLNVIFLDVDGVLNRCGASTVSFEQDLIELFHWIHQQAPFSVVLSSTWRVYTESLDRVETLLRKHDIPLLGVTPQLAPEKFSLAHARGDEIQAWLDDHRNPHPEHFVILDDDGDMGRLCPCLLKTDPFVGFTADHAREIIRRFTGGGRTGSDEYWEPPKAKPPVLIPHPKVSPG